MISEVEHSEALKQQAARYEEEIRRLRADTEALKRAQVAANEKADRYYQERNDAQREIASLHAERDAAAGTCRHVEEIRELNAKADALMAERDAAQTAMRDTMRMLEDKEADWNRRLHQLEADVKTAAGQGLPPQLVDLNQKAATACALLNGAEMALEKAASDSPVLSLIARFLRPEDWGSLVVPTVDEVCQDVARTFIRSCLRHEGMPVSTGEVVAVYRELIAHMVRRLSSDGTPPRVGWVLRHAEEVCDALRDVIVPQVPTGAPPRADMAPPFDLEKAQSTAAPWDTGADVESLHKMLQVLADAGHDVAGFVHPRHGEVSHFMRKHAEALELVAQTAGRSAEDMFAVHKEVLTQQLRSATEQIGNLQKNNGYATQRLATCERLVVAAVSWVEALAQRLPIGRLRSSALDWVKESREEEIPF